MTFQAGSIIADISMTIPEDVDFNMLYSGIAEGVENSEVMRSLGVIEAYINGKFIEWDYETDWKRNFLYISKIFTSKTQEIVNLQLQANGIKRVNKLIFICQS